MSSNYKLNHHLKSVAIAIIVMVMPLFLTSCATTEYSSYPTTTDTVPKPPLKKDGIYHKVQKGETLWRIAKAYGVDIDGVISSNQIPNAGAIEVNQLILIPGAKHVIDIPPAPTPSASATPSTTPSTTSKIEDLNKDEFVWPIKGRLASYFSDRKGDAVNKGIDIEVSSSDNIRAAREGKVILSDYVGSWGYTVMVDHQDGFISVYSQLDQNEARLGDRVSKGDVLGQMIVNGSRKLFHFQIRRGQTAVNPLYYLPQ